VTARPVVTRSRSVARSIAAVFAGLLAIVVASTAADLLLHATGVFPPAGEAMPSGLWLLAIGYRLAFGVLGGYVTASLAPARPMRHALVLGGIGVLIGLAGTVATWDRGPGFGPAWYALAVVAIALPSAWAGGRLRGRATRAPISA
jgi:hypothetical protein